MMDISAADNAALDAKVIQLERKGRFILFSELEEQSRKEWPCTICLAMETPA
jgi:hypothetical protein